MNPAVTVGVAIVGALGSVVLYRVARRIAARERAHHLGPNRVWIPSGLETRLARALTAADIEVGARGAVQMWLGAALAAVLLTVGVVPVGGGAVAALVLLAGPVVLYALRHRRDLRRLEALPDALESVAAHLRSGSTVSRAIELLAQQRSPLADDFGVINQRRALGASISEALHGWTQLRHSPAVHASAGALAVAAESGGQAAGALDGLATTLRDRLGVRAETRALSAQARFSAIVVGLAPFGYTLFAAVVDPASMRFLVGTPAGRACVVVALTLETVAVLWMRRLLKDEPL